jgi:hypothetical protein
LSRESGSFRKPRVHELSALIVQDDANTPPRSAQPRTRRE